jgi:RecB family endonuclease NucS
LFQTPQGNLVVVEVKFGRVGREAMRQVQNYMHDLRATEHSKSVTGVLVCSGVMPAFEEELRKQTKVRILVYGWRIQVQPWRIDSQSSPDEIIP